MRVCEMSAKVELADETERRDGTEGETSAKGCQRNNKGHMRTTCVSYYTQTAVPAPSEST